MSAVEEEGGGSGGKKDLGGLDTILSGPNLPAKHLIIQRSLRPSGFTGKCPILVLCFEIQIIGIDLSRDFRGWDEGRQQEYAGEDCALPALPMVFFVNLLDKGIPLGMGFFRLPSSSKVYALGGEKMRATTTPPNTWLLAPDEDFHFRGLSVLVHEFDPKQQPCLLTTSSSPPRMLAPKAQPFVLTIGDKIYVLETNRIMTCFGPGVQIDREDTPYFEVLEPAGESLSSWKWRPLPSPHCHLVTPGLVRAYPLVIGRHLFLFTSDNQTEVFDLDKECWTEVIDDDDYNRSYIYRDDDNVDDSDYDEERDMDDGLNTDGDYGEERDMDDSLNTDGKEDYGDKNIRIYSKPIHLVDFLFPESACFAFHHHSLCVPVDIPMLPNDGSYILLLVDGFSSFVEAHLLDDKLNVCKTQLLHHIFPSNLFIAEDFKTSSISDSYSRLIDQGSGRICAITCAHSPKRSTAIAVSIFDLLFVGDTHDASPSSQAGYKFLQVSIVKQYVYDASSIFVGSLLNAFFM